MGICVIANATTGCNGKGAREDWKSKRAEATLANQQAEECQRLRERGHARALAFHPQILDRFGLAGEAIGMVSMRRDAQA